MTSNSITSAGKFELGLDGNKVDVVGVDLRGEAIEVYQHVGHVALLLDELKTARDGGGCAVSIPLPVLNVIF